MLEQLFRSRRCRFERSEGGLGKKVSLYSIEWRELNGIFNAVSVSFFDVEVSEDIEGVILVRIEMCLSLNKWVKVWCIHCGSSFSVHFC